MQSVAKLQKFLCFENGEVLMKLIERPMYLQRLMELRGTPDIKIITGVRRCGKSQLITSWAQKVSEIDPSANIISIDLTSLLSNKWGAVQVCRGTFSSLFQAH